MKRFIGALCAIVLATPVLALEEIVSFSDERGSKSFLDCSDANLSGNALWMFDASVISAPTDFFEVLDPIFCVGVFDYSGDRLKSSIEFFRNEAGFDDCRDGDCDGDRVIVRPNGFIGTIEVVEDGEVIAITCLVAGNLYEPDGEAC